MKPSDHDSVMKHASSAVTRTGNWSRAKRDYANKVTRAGSISPSPNLPRQNQSQETSSSSGQKK
jgi:hypothetical protein